MWTAPDLFARHHRDGGKLIGDDGQGAGQRIAGDGVGAGAPQVAGAAGAADWGSARARAVRSGSVPSRRFRVGPFALAARGGVDSAKPAICHTARKRPNIGRPDNRQRYNVTLDLGAVKSNVITLQEMDRLCLQHQSALSGPRSLSAPAW